MAATTEDKLIERLRRRIPSSAGGALRLGIGDDAALIRTSPGMEFVVSTDQFLEGVHFLPDVHPADMVGYKAVARATSDLGAMGARPALFLVSLALPAARTGRWCDAMLAGMGRAARKLGLRLAGGDTARSAAVALDVTVLGEIAKGKAVRRGGARPGDAVFVSGQLGAAQLGLELVLKRLHRRARWRRLLDPHYYPEPPIQLGQWLARRGLASAMMDLSDGLSTDLDRLCKASRAGALIEESAIPAVSVPRGLQERGFDARAMALHGGEDYGLLFTVPPRLSPEIPRAFRGDHITRIGEIVRGAGVRLASAKGRVWRLEPRGWDHFADPKKRPAGG